MKIILLTLSLNEKSGWGRHARAIIDELHSAGAQVEVFSADKVGGLAYPVRLLMPLSSRFVLPALIGNILRVRRAARSADVVHALEGWPLGVYAWGAVLGRRTPFFMNGVGTYSVAPLYAFGKRALMRAVYRKVKKVFCISNYTKQELLRAGVPAERLTVVHFGVPMLPIPSEAAVFALREKYGIDPGRFPVVLTVGAIKDRKGQLDTLKAAGILKEKYSQILYVVAGSTNEQAYVAEMRQYAQVHDFAEHVRIIEGAGDSEISCLYALCTVFVLASTNDSRTHHFEGFGAVITEACQFGKPSVGSADCGIEDAIKPGVSGLLSRQRDPQDIAEKIQTVLNDYEKFSAGALAFGREFSWQETVQTYLKHYVSFK